VKVRLQAVAGGGRRGPGCTLRARSRAAAGPPCPRPPSHSTPRRSASRSARARVYTGKP